jgi:hypothetical protein
LLWERFSGYCAGIDGYAHYQITAKPPFEAWRLSQINIFHFNGLKMKENDGRCILQGQHWHKRLENDEIPVSLMITLTDFRSLYIDL